MNINIFLKKALCLILIICLALTFCSCNGKGSVSSISNEIKPIATKNPSSKYHSTGNLKSVCKSGLYELLVDDKNFSFALIDSNGGMWYGLPVSENVSASLLSLDVSDGKTIYRLNSQDNSVAYGTAKIKISKSGVTFSYVLSEKKDNPKFKIPVSLNLYLNDGLLNISVDCSKISTGDKNYKISSVSIAPYFGAVTNPVDGDFILLPDGSGALIDLAKAENNSYAIETYGADYSVEKQNNHAGIVAAFGLKHQANAFAAIVTDGSAISSINADTTKGSGIDTAYASFNITPNGYSKEAGTTKFALANQSYEGKIGVCYRFVSGSSATYSGIAAICREQLVRNGDLSTRTVESDTELPINVTLIGALKNGIGRASVYTSFENAEDIANVLKAKGVDALNLKYDGAFTGGLNQKQLGKAKLLSSLGNSKELESLENYMSTQGFNLYFSVDLVTSASGGNIAKGVLDSKVKINTKNPLVGYMGGDTFEFEGISKESLVSNVVKFMNRMKDENIPGYCISDAGVLYSDCSGNFSSRQDLADTVYSQAIALSTNKNLMVDTGNVYALKNALIISNIPMTSTYKEQAYYTAVPFIQMILHGTAEYTGEYLNLSEDYNSTLLKCVEYGALPAFEWTYTEYIPKDKDKSQLYYDNWTSQAVDAYKMFNTSFSDLRGAKMTDHTKIQDGLYCTMYNNETYVYVNYSGTDIVYNNLTIKAGSYLRVN